MGLLDGVLPAVYSAGNKLKRQVGGLLSDPVGTVQQQIGLLNDKAGAFNQLHSQATQEAVNAARTGAGIGPAQQKIAGTLADAYNPVGMIDPKALGLPVNKNGTVTLYHGTTKDAAPRIVASRELRSAAEPNVYLTTATDAGYGDGTLVAVDVHPRFLNLDDEFPDGRLDFSIDAPSKVFRVSSARLIGK